MVLSESAQVLKVTQDEFAKMVEADLIALQALGVSEDVGTHDERDLYKRLARLQLLCLMPRPELLS